MIAVVATSLPACGSSGGGGEGGPEQVEDEVTEEARRRVDQPLLSYTADDETLVDSAAVLARHGGQYVGVRFFERDMGPGRESLVVA